MNYKGYNIAVHEMGHNVEQTLLAQRRRPHPARRRAQHRLHRGARLRLPGTRPGAARPAAPDARDRALKTLNDFWGTYEIAGVALVDMAVWHWMYDHPEATPDELRDATLQIAKDIWNRYYAPVFGKKDVVLLGIYSHMIDPFSTCPTIPLGHLIAFQIEEQMQEGRQHRP